MSGTLSVIIRSPSQEEPLADIVSVIKEQHRLVDRLLEQAAEEGADTAALIRQVADHLLPHSEAEESFVYPTIRTKSEDAGDEVKDGIEEHHHIEDMLRTLLEQEPGDPGYDGTLAALTAELRHHVEEEEEDLLPVLQASSSAEELERLGERFEQATTGSGDGGSGGADSGGETKAELYEKAKEQDVGGRSTMTKEELRDAVD
jgi:hemerythrin superfamily protein